MKKQGKSIQGKSFWLNFISIALNLIGLTFILLGFHENYETSHILFKVLGFTLFIFGGTGLVIFQGWYMFSYFARILVGGLFIVSGLIKTNDPIGFSYKLEEYFEDGALAYRIKEFFNWPTFSLDFLIEHALTISILICIAEIVFGVLVIIGSKIRLSAWSMLIMMIFFSLLTLHTKECDSNNSYTDIDYYETNSPIAKIKIQNAASNENIQILNNGKDQVKIAEIKKPQCVDDCGCFGDAMKGSIGRSLTPSESFWKDLILLYFVLIIFINQRSIQPNTIRENTLLIIGSLLFVSIFSWIFSWGFPIFFALTSILSALWIKKTGGKIIGNDWGALLIVTVISSLLCTYVIMYNPIKDYRPYSVGSNLIEKMNDEIKEISKNTLVYQNKSTGEFISIRDDQFSDSILVKGTLIPTSAIWNDTLNWVWKETKKDIIQKGKLASITEQFDPKIILEEVTALELEIPYVKSFIAQNSFEYIDIFDHNNNHYPQLLTDFYKEDWDTSIYYIGDTIIKLDESISEISLRDSIILNADNIILIISKDLKQANFSRMDRLLDIHSSTQKFEIPMYLITTANKSEIEEFRKNYKLHIPFLINDETEIKTISRSNPTLMVLQNGIVRGKYSFRSTPSWDWLNENIFHYE